jgi:hypothetical protein
MQQLHEATKRFGTARRELERTMDGSEYRHQERVNVAEEQFREAERELERIDEAIKGTLQDEQPKR